MSPRDACALTLRPVVFGKGQPMRGQYRKTAPKVRAGQVLRKNRIQLSPQYALNQSGNPVIERHRPGAGSRHLIKKRDLDKFIELLPNWDSISVGLRAIILDEGRKYCMGWHRPGVIAVCAWEREISGEWCRYWLADHQPILEQLGVKREQVSEHYDFVHWSEVSARGFQLMHILLHELGHHHDRMTTKSRRRSARGEDFAEQYAIDLAGPLWTAYFDTFGW